MDISFKDWLLDYEFFRFIEGARLDADVTRTNMGLNSIFGTKNENWFGVILSSLPSNIKGLDKQQLATDVATEIWLAVKDPGNELHKYIFIGHEGQPAIMSIPDPAKKRETLVKYIHLRARWFAGQITKPTVMQTHSKTTSALGDYEQEYLGNIPVAGDKEPLIDLEEVKRYTIMEMERKYQEAKQQGKAHKTAYYFLSKQIAEKRLEHLSNAAEDPSKILIGIGPLTSMTWHQEDGSPITISRGNMFKHLKEIEEVMKVVINNMMDKTYKKVG